MWVLSVAVARSTSAGVATGYFLPILWMTSCFHTVASMVRNVYPQALRG